MGYFKKLAFEQEEEAAREAFADPYDVRGTEPERRAARDRVRPLNTYEKSLLNDHLKAVRRAVKAAQQAADLSSREGALSHVRYTQTLLELIVEGLK